MTENQALETIQEEELCLKSTYDSLLQQKQRSEARFSVESERSRELTAGLVSTRRVEDKVQLASDEAISHSLVQRKQEEILELEQLLEKPYFGRIRVSEELNGKEQAFEYKLGYTANSDCRIIDWRKAPLSKLYYEYKEGDDYFEVIQGRERSGTITLRNAVETKRDSLTQITCRYGTFVHREGEWKPVTLDRSASRASGSEGALPNILSLITPDQFRTITEDANSAVLIQGIAGSGKTTVALHRLAWLLHGENSDLKPEDAVILVLNQALKRYVSQTLPSMEIFGVRVLSYFEWAWENVSAGLAASGQNTINLDRTGEPSSSRRIKGSLGILQAAEEFVAKAERTLLASLQSRINWGELPQGAFVAFNRLLDGPKRPYYKTVSELRGLFSKVAEAVPAGHPKRAGLDFARKLLEEELGKRGFSARDLLEVLSDQALILEADETKLLDRESLNMVRIRTEQNLEQGRIEPSDLPILLRLLELKSGFFYVQGKSRAAYRHIVLDEVQDFNPVALATVIGAVEKSHQLTIVGDTAQQLTAETPFPVWEALQKRWSFSEEISNFLTLSVSHRSTKQIMSLADHVLGNRRSDVGREGKAPVWYRCSSEKQGIIEAIGWLSKAREKFPNAVVAVICADKDQARGALSMLRPTFGPAVFLGEDEDFNFSSGIVVTDVKQTKGLEFFAVLLWNPSSSNYPADQLGRNRLYTAITRAESYVGLVSWGTPSKLLPSASANLRIVDCSPEVE